MKKILSKHFLVILIILAAAFRFYNLSSNPPALYWDEASIAYNAFSILKEGIDEHGVPYPITHFLAFGDAKPPLYIYATSLSMAIFGVTEFAVRFSSAFAGTIAVAITYFLTKEFFTNHNHKHSIARITSLLLAVSPWHLQMSRAGFEANLGLTLFLAGLLFFIKSRSKPKLILLSAVLFASTLYTFNSYRIFLPLFLILLTLIYRKQLFSNLKWASAGLVVGVLVTLPLIPFLLSDQARLRFNEVSIFNNHAPILEANQRNQLNQNAFWSKLLHNRRWLFALDFLSHYSDHFKPDFLFISGDANPRLSTRDQGQLYLIELPLLLFGLYTLIKTKQPSTKLIIFWLLLAFIPAGIARETPHALRSLQILPAPQILVAFGIITLASKHKHIPKLLILSYSLLIISYLDTYHLHYSNHWANSWQYGYKQLVEYITPIQDNYDKIFITKKLGRPHTYFLFYQQINPIQYVANRDASGDAFGFTYVDGFGKYRFGDTPPFDSRGEEKWLIVSGADAVPSQTNFLARINDLNNQPVFTVSDLK